MQVTPSHPYSAASTSTRNTLSWLFWNTMSRLESNTSHALMSYRPPVTTTRPSPREQPRNLNSGSSCTGCCTGKISEPLPTPRESTSPSPVTTHSASACRAHGVENSGVASSGACSTRMRLSLMRTPSTLASAMLCGPVVQRTSSPLLAVRNVGSEVSESCVVHAAADAAMVARINTLSPVIAGRRVHRFICV